MEIVHYIVARLDGDYAILMPADGSGGENPVALALLPDAVTEGSRLRWEDLSYELE